MASQLLCAALVTVATGTLVSACMWDLESTERAAPSPTGPIARSADEAWPGAPAGVAPVSEPQILDACETAGSCSAEVMAFDVQTRLALVDLCVFDAVFSAERAVPVSGFGHYNERLEYWVACVLGASRDCATVSSCHSERDPSVACEEQGCRSSVPWEVRCEGSVATLRAGDRVWQRDCARAFVGCDEASPTGCDDRLPTACPPEGLGAEPCDGGVWLGCDETGQIRYHDCQRLGGSCVESTSGATSCRYPTPLDPECSVDAPASASCAGTELAVCVNGQRLRLSSELCVPSAAPPP
jgi:hypothetical protein